MAKQNAHRLPDFGPAMARLRTIADASGDRLLLGDGPPQETLTPDSLSQLYRVDVELVQAGAALFLRASPQHAPQGSPPAS